MKKIALALTLLFVSLFSFGQTAQEKQRAKNLFIKTAKEFNQQLPMYIDDYTTLTSVVFLNWVWTYNFHLTLDRNDYSLQERNEILNEVKTNMNAEQRKMIDAGAYNMKRSEFKWFMKQAGFKFKYNYIDANELVFGTFYLTYLNF